jgi:hypothetical protein
VLFALVLLDGFWLGDKDGESSRRRRSASRQRWGCDLVLDRYRYRNRSTRWRGGPTRWEWRGSGFLLLFLLDGFLLGWRDRLFGGRLLLRLLDFDWLLGRNGGLDGGRSSRYDARKEEAASRDAPSSTRGDWGRG